MLFQNKHNHTRIPCPAVSLEDWADGLARNVGNYYYSLLNSPEARSSQE